MNLNIYKTYALVIETQNLSRTADELGISQPAVTKQIQALEDFYGVLLLERAGRGIKTTEAGRVLYNCTQNIIKEIDKTEMAMQSILETGKDVLAIGASSIPGQYILPNLVKEFKADHPHTSISLVITDTQTVFKRISEWEQDVGIVGGWNASRKIDGFKWIEDELVVVVPRDNCHAGRGEVAIKELLQENWILRNKGSGTRKAMENLLESLSISVDDLNIYLEVGSSEAIITMIEQGIGISIVSKWALKNFDNRNKIAVLKIKDRIKRDFYVIYPHQKARRKIVNEFLDYLSQAAKNPALGDLAY